MHYFSPWNGERFPSENRRWDPVLLVAARTRQGGVSPHAGGTGAIDRSGLTKTQADDLLDWLEANGYEKYEVTAVNEECFSVRWWD